jgi:hypothetical protein
VTHSTLLLGRQIASYQGLTAEGWRRRQLRYPELYGCIEVRSYGAGRRGYITAFESSSLDWAERIVAMETSAGRRRAPPTVVSGGSAVCLRTTPPG